MSAVRSRELRTDCSSDELQRSRSSRPAERSMTRATFACINRLTSSTCRCRRSVCSVCGSDLQAAAAGAELPASALPGAVSLELWRRVCSDELDVTEPPDERLFDDSFSISEEPNVFRWRSRSGSCVATAPAPAAVDVLRVRDLDDNEPPPTFSLGVGYGSGITLASPPAAER